MKATHLPRRRPSADPVATLFETQRGIALPAQLRAAGVGLEEEQRRIAIDDADPVGRAVDDALRRRSSPAWMKQVADRWTGHGTVDDVHEAYARQRILLAAR